jgi:hypothetical protein
MKTVLQIALLTMALAGIAAANDIVVATPEISGGSAVSALGLLGGVLLVMRSRRKK